MKRVKALNGYTIYMITARDEKRGIGTEGEYNIYFSSDIRDYGVEYSTPEYDGIDSLDIALELCGDNTAIIKEALEAEYTAVSYEDIEEEKKRRAELTGKTITINGVDFENITAPKQRAGIIDDINSTYLSSLFDIYNRPSNTKIDIFHEWSTWFEDIDAGAGRFGCLRGSSNTFSIGAVTSYAGRELYFYITKDHNRVVVV